MDTGGFAAVKWTVCKADHSPPVSVDVEAAPHLIMSSG